jgi:hypothetical protein
MLGILFCRCLFRRLMTEKSMDSTYVSDAVGVFATNIMKKCAGHPKLDDIAENTVITGIFSAVDRLAVSLIDWIEERFPLPGLCSPPPFLELCSPSLCIG